MPNFLILFALIVICLAVWWASRRDRNGVAKPEVVASGTKPLHPMAWVVFLCFGLVFAAAGVWMCVDPWVPSGGGKGGTLVAYLANFLLGDYGPAIIFLGLAAACFYEASRYFRRVR